MTHLPITESRKESTCVVDLLLQSSFFLDFSCYMHNSNYYNLLWLMLVESINEFVDVFTAGRLFGAFARFDAAGEAFSIDGHQGLIGWDASNCSTNRSCNCKSSRSHYGGCDRFARRYTTSTWWKGEKIICCSRRCN